jgi:hypothetical protein
LALFKAFPQPNAKNPLKMREKCLHEGATHVIYGISRIKAGDFEEETWQVQ